jgi:hypothetical protein
MPDVPGAPVDASGGNGNIAMPDSPQASQPSRLPAVRLPSLGWLPASNRPLDGSGFPCVGGQ